MHPSSTVTGKDVSLKAKGDVRLEAGENTSVTTSENKTSAASIGASFSSQGLSGLSLSASSAKGKNKESRTSYTPTEVKAAGTLKLESGKDTNILGSKAKGEKIEANVGGNLTIETLQEKETYEAKNTSAGFNLSWSMNQMLDPAGSGKILRSFSKPTIGASVSKGSLESYYRSAHEQAGIFAGKDGFDIYVEKNTDLKGAVIASEATAGKNRLSTGTFSFSDLENEADYNSKSIGAEYHHYGSYDKMGRQEKNKVYNTIGLSPSLSMPAKGDANSTTKAAVAPGTIDIRENPTQDISALNRDTNNALNELGRIFDKQKIEEQQELAKAFGEEAFRLAHNLPDDGSGRKIAVHAIIGGIMSQITGAGFASGAIGAGVNEAVIGEIKKIKDPGTAQIVSAIVGAAAAKAAGEAAGAGATSAASGTKNNNAAVAIPEMALTALVFAMGYVLITDEKGNQSISNTIDGIPKTIAEYSEDIGAWLDTNGDTIDSEIQDFIVWAKSGFELKRMPKDKIDELGGEDFTREVKKQTGKSKSDLYWNPKTGEVYSVPKKGGEPEHVADVEPRK